jgi:hypothetical protein
MSLVLHLEAEPVETGGEPAGGQLPSGGTSEPTDAGAAAPGRAPEWEIPRWRFGAGVGGNLRGGVGPGLAGAIDAHAMLRSEGSGWGSGPLSIGFSWAPPATSATPDGSAEWSHRWWAGSVAAVPGTFTLTPRIRVGPVVGFQVGRHWAIGPGVAGSAKTLAFSELLMRAEVELRPWVVAAQLGFQLPIAPQPVSYDGGLLHRSDPGLVLGLGASWVGVVL